MQDPAGLYRQRLTEREATAATLQAREQRLANLRLITALAGVAMAWPAIAGGWGALLLVPFLAFVGLVIAHDRVIRRRVTAERAVALYRQGIGRVSHQWAGSGEQGERYRDAEHPYSEDLDLFGRGSLYERLCQARTRSGQDCLAGWLLAPADTPTVAERQAAVRDLTPRLDLRETLVLSAGELQTGADTARLVAWGAAPTALRDRWPLAAAYLLGALALAALAAGSSGFGWLPLLVVLVLEGLLAVRTGGPVRTVLQGAEAAGRDLALLGRLLAPLEWEAFESSLLLRLQEELSCGGRLPSEALLRLERLLGWMDVMRNGVFGTLAWLLQLHIPLAYAAEGWRREHGPSIAAWLEITGQIEALSSLGAYAFENPRDPYPELTKGEPRLEVTGVAHPLLPREKAVPNDVSLGADLRLLVVSGSNMSGKSTLLRSLGINCVLAQAGAPVRAEQLLMTPLQVGSSLRIRDDLEAGVSHFYAEIRRLRTLVELTGETELTGEAEASEGAERQPNRQSDDKRPPLLFLLDEILHGTNSHDRRIGAEAVLAALVLRGAIGLVTTHDLALTEIVLSEDLKASNIHFQDDLQEGTMHFDYHLRAGVVRKSNALALMRAVGLPVDLPTNASVTGPSSREER